MRKMGGRYRVFKESESSYFMFPTRGTATVNAWRQAIRPLHTPVLNVGPAPRCRVTVSLTATQMYGHGD